MSQNRILNALLLAAAAMAVLRGQTQVDLRTQSKSIDFSGANITKPMAAGQTLPGTCTTGQMYFLVTAPPGQNLYACVSANVWTLQSGGGGAGSVPPVAGNGGDLLTTDGTNVLWTALGGDLSGTVAAVQVTQLQGHPVSPAVPGPGQTLIWNGLTNEWTPQLSSAGGVQLSSQLQDLAAATSGSATLTIGQNCGVATPCNFRIGSVTYPIAAPATVTLSGGTGLAYVYLTGNGALTVGSNLPATCNSVCMTQSGITAFPSTSIPLYTASATNGVWNANGISDYRAFLSVKNVVGSSGVVSVDSGGAAMLSLDGSVVSLKVSVPGTSSSACTANQWSTDGAYYYLCVSNNLWKRTALSSW